MFGQHNVSRNECGRESKQIIRLLSMNQLCNKKKQNKKTKHNYYFPVLLRYYFNCGD